MPGTLTMMLGLACSIDDALFVVSRYREERAKGHAPQEPAALATGTAGAAGMFAGLTVVIAVAELSMVDTPPQGRRRRAVRLADEQPHTTTIRPYSTGSAMSPSRIRRFRQAHSTLPATAAR